MSAQPGDVTSMRIEIARASLKRKVAALEHRCGDTVARTMESVHQVTDTLKSTVHHATDGMKYIQQFASQDALRRLSVRTSVRQSPWCSLGIAVVAGFVSAGFMRRKAPHPQPTNNHQVNGHVGFRSVLKRELFNIGESVIADVAVMVREHLHNLADAKQHEEAPCPQAEAHSCCAAAP